MEKNNVRVQAIPSHCTEQSLKELEGKELYLSEDLDFTIIEKEISKDFGVTESDNTPSLEGMELDLGDNDLRKNLDKEKISQGDLVKINTDNKEVSKDYICYINRHEPGVVFIKDNEIGFKRIDLLKKVIDIPILDNSGIEALRAVNIKRDLKYDIKPEVKSGLNNYKFYIHAMCTNFWKAVLPSFTKIQTKQIDSRVKSLSDVFGLELDSTTIKRIVGEFLRDKGMESEVRDTNSTEAYSRTLEENVVCVKLLSKYIGNKNEFLFKELVEMFAFFLESVEDFVEGYTSNDLALMLPRLIATPQPTGVYKTITDLLTKEFNTRFHVENFCYDDFDDWEEDKDKSSDVKEIETWVIGAKGYMEYLKDLSKGVGSIPVLDFGGIVNDPIDIPASSLLDTKYCSRVQLEKRDLVIGTPIEENKYMTKIIPGVVIDTEGNSTVGLSLDSKQLDSVDEFISRCRGGNKQTGLVGNATVMLNYGVGTPKEDCGFLKDMRVSVAETANGNMITLCIEEKHIETLEKFTEMYRRKSLLEYAKKEEMKEEIKTEESKQYGEPVRVSMNIRDIEDDYACYTEVELDFSKAHLFQYCPETGELLAKLDEDEEVYKPILKENREPLSTPKEEPILIRMYATDIDTGKGLIATVDLSNGIEKRLKYSAGAQIYVRKMGDNYVPVLEDEEIDNH